MKLFQTIYSIPELSGLSREEKKRVLKACRIAPWKSKKVWFSMVLLFLASTLINTIPKLIILSFWYWKIKSDIIQKLILLVAPWPALIIALEIFGIASVIPACAVTTLKTRSL